MKKLITLLLVLAMSALVLCSCDLSAFMPSGEQSECTDEGTEGGDGSGENKPVAEKENLIYSESTELYMVYDPQEVSYDQVDKIASALLNKGIYVIAYDMNQEAKPHEIVIGNVGRAVSNSAYIQLERIDKGSDHDLRYCVYSDGSSVAIAYDEHAEDYAIDEAIEAFISDYVKSELVLAKGTYNKTSFNLYDYLLEFDSDYYAESWQKVAKQAGDHGASLVSSLQALYSLYDGEKLITWLANLYDTSICVCKDLYGKEECEGNVFCGTGGFYYSNSGRDNVGYLPDAESTNQALGFISDCGIAAGVGGNYVSVVPDWMAEQIIAFIYNLQDPDGFFYHPQWGKAIGDSRRSRDYNWCRNILSAYGVKTKYQTMGDLAVETASPFMLSERLGGSTVAAVSKVILADDETRIPEHLQTLEAFKAYVIGQDVYNKSYVAGNNFSSQSSQIKTRPKEYGEFLISHLNEVYNHYNNGTWHHTINYYAINGVMKISGVYSGFGAEIPNGELACLAAFEAVSSDQETGGIVDIWNTWEAVVRVLTNIKKYSENGEQKVAELREKIFEEAPGAILKTREKLNEFLKMDGSFSYKKTSSSATSQGVPVAISGTNEGDVNATVIGSTYMISSIFSSLGMSKVTICRSRERAIFLDIVNDLSPVQKGTGSTAVTDPIDFDYDDVGEEPVDVSIGSGAVGTVIEDVRGKGNVLRYEAGVNPGSEGKYNNNYLLIRNEGPSTGANSMVFSGEFCFEENIPTNDAFRIELGREGDANNVYRLTFRKASDGSIAIYETSANSPTNAIVNDLGLRVRVGEWFKLRVEYYKGDHSSVRIKVFFNDKLCAISDNYYDSNGVKLSGEGTPKSDFKNTRFYSLNAYKLNILMDNLHSYSSLDTYVPEALLHPDFEANPYSINVDRKYDAADIYDFEDAESETDYPARLTVGAVEVAKISKIYGTNALLLSGGSYVYVPQNKLSVDANCSTFGFKLLPVDNVNGAFATISFSEASSTKSAINFTLATETVDGEKVVVFKDGAGRNISGVSFPADETTEVRIDFYENEKIALIYVNGKVKGLTAEINMEGKGVKYAKAIFTAIGEQIAVDDLSASRCTNDYAAATAPKYEGKVYDFTNGLDGITVSGSGVTVSKGQLNYSTQSGGSFTVPATDRDDIMSLSNLVFDIQFTTKKDGAAHELTLYSEDGSEVIAFVIAINSSDAQIFEKTALGVHAKPILTFDATAVNTLKFRIFELDSICKIYLNNEFKTETNLIYSKANAKLPVSYATFSAGDVNTVATFDNISLDRVNELYYESPSSKPEAGATEITFDYASGPNYSDKLTASINSAVDKPTVVEVDKNGEPDKALKFSTAEGTAMDGITVQFTNPVSNAVSYVFQADLMIESSRTASPYQIWFVSGSSYPLQLNITVSNNTVYFHHGNKDVVKYNTGVQYGEWMTFRIESYFLDGRVKGKVFINDELAYTVEYYQDGSDVIADMFVDGELYSHAITTNNEKVVSGLSKVEFKALKASVAVCYLDNVSLSGSTKTYE